MWTKLYRIGSFPNDDSRRIVISLSGPIFHIVQISRYDDCWICAHMAHHLGQLPDYIKSYWVPLSTDGSFNDFEWGSKKENERNNMNLLKMWNNMEIGLMLGPQMLSQRLLSPTMLCSLATARLQGVMDVTDAYETQHLIHLLLHHMICYYARRSVVYTSAVEKQRFASPKLLKLFTIIRWVLVPHWHQGITSTLKKGFFVNL